VSGSSIRRRWSRSIVIVALVTASAGCFQQGAFYVVPEHSDLGIIDNDARVATAEFVIVNGLNRPVEIKHIYPSCNCAELDLRQNPIAPRTSTVLSVTVNLSQQAGRQETSVLLVTDSTAFPQKRVSMAALVPASGVYQRRVDIGVFHPGDAIDFETPSTSFSRGLVELGREGTDDSGVAVDLVPQPSDETRLVVTGTAPQVRGEFLRQVSFRESFPDEPALGEGVIELQLVGTVVPKWDVKAELYAGFVSLSKDRGRLTLQIENNAARTTRRTIAPTGVRIAIQEDWLSLEDYNLSSDGAKLVFRIHEQNLGKLGAQKAPMEFVVDYADGLTETYSTTVFAHIEP
jgi:hypothetical protein